MDRHLVQTATVPTKRPALLIAAALGFAAVLLPGCIKQGRPTAMVERHVFEYALPTFKELRPLNQLLKVERFSVAKAYNSLSIVYRPEPYTLDTYANNRWMANPGDMVSDFLLRDLRGSGLFRAVFSFRDLEDARYVIEGSIEEIVERDEAPGRCAVIALHVTLLDLARPGMESRLVFQKEYRAIKPLPAKTAAGLAQAMSHAMAQLSSAIIKDVHSALQATHP
jgi:ABC-type uncharacterized transport system auxiliary subunit